MRVKREFYCQSTIRVAKSLLGKQLVRVLANGERLVGKIVETEAYLGPEDLASHSARGRRTARNEVMYGEKGRAYVYFIYGRHHCLNVVTGPQGKPEAVLVRAVEPVGDEGMGRRVDASGPGKLCRWMGIDQSLNGEDLVISDRLWIEAGGDPAPNVVGGKRGRVEEVVESTRVGVDYAGEWAKKLLRFYLKGNPFVSQK